MGEKGRRKPSDPHTTAPGPSDKACIGSCPRRGRADSGKACPHCGPSDSGQKHSTRKVMWWVQKVGSGSVRLLENLDREAGEEPDSESNCSHPLCWS